MSIHQYLMKTRQGDARRVCERDPSDRGTAARRGFPATMNNSAAASIHPFKDGPP
jgi:hypothetical protein